MQTPNVDYRASDKETKMEIVTMNEALKIFSENGFSEVRRGSAEYYYYQLWTKNPLGIGISIMQVENADRIDMHISWPDEIIKFYPKTREEFSKFVQKISVIPSPEGITEEGLEILLLGHIDPEAQKIRDLMKGD